MSNQAAIERNSIERGTSEFKRATEELTNPIDPKFGFRFSTEEIMRAYSSLETAFEEGAYLLVAEMAPPGSELEGCGLALGGALGRGLAVLKARGSLTPRGLVCRAFAEWSLGRNDDARATLATVPVGSPYTAKGRALQSLIDKKEITVFVTAAFLPVPTITEASTSARNPVHRYGPFLVKQVGTQMEANAYDYGPHQEFDRFIERLPAAERPDFIFALTPLWLPPKNLEKVQIPKVIWCHDGDVFSYRAFDNLNLYDVRIVNTTQEQFELGRAFGKFCASNLMLDPLSGNFPQCRTNVKKEFDVVFTGSAFDAFHAEKSRFIYQLASLGDCYRVAVFDGYMPQGEYYELLSRSKFLPIVNRYAGCPSPRWRDALANSAYVLYPRGTAFGKAFSGCFAYDTASIADDVRDHLDRYNAGEAPYDLLRTMEEIDGEMSIFREKRDEVFERLLKLAAFTALVVRPANKAAWRPEKRRLVWLTPCIDPPIYGQDNIRKKIVLMAEATPEAELSDEQDFSNLAHLYAQLALYFHYVSVAELEDWRSRADRLFAEGCRRYPKSLLLWFNRAHWTFFRDAGGKAAAASLFRALLERWDSFEFSPMGAEVGFPYTLLEKDRIFAYYEYSQLATSLAAQRKESEARVDGDHLCGILKATAYGYLGWEALERNDFAAAFGHLRESLRIHPDNLVVLRFMLDTELSHGESQNVWVPALAQEICDTFIGCANRYPAILLTHAHRVCASFAATGRIADLRHVLDGWYRLGNITYSTKPEERLEREIDRIVGVCRFADHLPGRLMVKLAPHLGGAAEPLGLTQFENLVLVGLKRVMNVPKTPGAPESSRDQKSTSAPAEVSIELASKHVIAETPPAPVPPPAAVPSSPVEIIGADEQDTQRRLLLARLNDMEKAMVALTSSKSWRMTRPLRQWNGRLKRLAAALGIRR